ncbi:MAG TPA: HD domain-containing phosphohydrolase, partial [Armatimonadota bacterium]|nr:HD domain-containing phosphohydrolase [Armatimonadota bacterium]
VSRVREYALALARKLGVAADELQAIGIASLLHDIGKIGIPERILCKPGKLTPEEFEIIKSHVEIGVVILEQVRFPWPVVPIVWTHHERWDGLGYPAGLKTEAIPMGGRIISLVDVFDALTSDRPYRQAIPRDKALEILRSSSGTQFDPKVVETFIEILPEVDALLEAKEASAAADTDAPFPLLAEDIAPGSGWQQAEADALLQELAEGLRAEQLPEAMAARLAEGISRMVPFSTFAVYLTVPPSLGGSAHPALVPLYSSGLWTELLDGMEIRVGEGVSGTVAATATPLMNVQASLDLARRVRPGDNLELNSTLCVPLLVDGAVTGTITLYHSAYNLYQPEHLEFLTQVAAAAAPALARTGSRDEKMPLDESPMTALPASFSVSQLLHRHITLAQSRNEEPV